MSDFDAVPPREEPHDGAHAAVRDALPAFLHGRATASERAAVERHLATCTACDAELQLLASVRDLYDAPAPGVSVDRIAAAVRARTIVAPGAPIATPVRSQILGGIPPQRAASVSRLPAWARRTSVRAFAASALLAVGSAVLAVGGPRTARRTLPTTVIATATPGTVAVAPAPTRDPSGTVLGASFADLSDSELAAVVEAVADPRSSTPAAEPAPVAPSVLAPEGE